MDYREFFRLREHPFRITPDPAYFFPSDGHREALQTLFFSIRSGEGFVQITGEPGTGKTLLIRTILKELGDEVATALILNPNLTPAELLKVLLEDLGLDPAEYAGFSREEHLRWFRDYLLAKAASGEKVVCIIDEAQNLPIETMEELRMLSNLETEKQKLLQIIMVGQLELKEKLKAPNLKQLHQRITIRYRLRHLNPEEIEAYIYHRLKIAGTGGQAPDLRFTRSALRLIYRWSRGIPRLINVICERGVMAAYVEGKHKVDGAEIKKAVESIKGSEELPKAAYTVNPLVVALPALLLVLLVAAAVAWQVNPALLAGLPWVDRERLTLQVQERELQEQARAVRRQEEDVRLHEAEIRRQEEALGRQLATVLGQEDEMLARQQELTRQEEELREQAELLGDSAAEREELARLTEERLRLAAQQEELSGELAAAHQESRRMEAEAAAKQAALSEELAAVRREAERTQAEAATRQAELSGELAAARQETRRMEADAAARLAAEQAARAEESRKLSAEAEAARQTTDSNAASRLEGERQKLTAELEAARRAGRQAEETAARLAAEREQLAAELASSRQAADRQEEMRLEAERAKLAAELDTARQVAMARMEESGRTVLERNDQAAANTLLPRAVTNLLRPGTAANEALVAVPVPAVAAAPPAYDDRRPPPLVVSAAPGAVFASLDLGRGQLSIWRSGGEGTELLARREVVWNHGPGLFLVGDDPAFGSYLFNHLAVLRGRPAAAPADFWQQLAAHTKGNAMALVAHQAPGGLETAAAGRGLEPLFADFLGYWSKMDSQQLFEHYTPMVTRHRLDRPQPQIFSRQQAAQRRERIFSRNNFIEIEAAQPVFIIDPVDPAAAMVVYQQSYRSRTWNDDGTKVVYFSRPDRPDPDQWQVSAELWVSDR